jgi:hypothetical protein
MEQKTQRALCTVEKNCGPDRAVEPHLAAPRIVALKGRSAVPLNAAVTVRAANGREVHMYGRRPQCKGKESDIFAERSGAAMYGRRPQCKGKESDIFAERSGAAMYSAFECSRYGCWP